MAILTSGQASRLVDIMRLLFILKWQCSLQRAGRWTDIWRFFYLKMAKFDKARQI